MPSVVEHCLQKDGSVLSLELRQRICRGSGCCKIFYICRSCDRGHAYCSQECRRHQRLAQKRKSNRIYQKSLAAKLDHADRQRAYIQRRKLKIVTGQGSRRGGLSASMVAIEQIPTDALPSSESFLCIICGRPGRQAFCARAIKEGSAWKTILKN